MVKKLRIKESAEPANKINEFIKAFKADLRKIASIDPDTATYDDLLNINWNSFNLKGIISTQEEKGLSVDDCIDKLITIQTERIAYLKNKQKEYTEYNTRVNNFKSVLDRYLTTNYNVIENKVTEDGIYWYIELPEGARHKDCIEFVDGVVDAVNGKYSGTARGGSWTTWDIRTADGIRVRAGWGNPKNCWKVEIPYAVYH